MTFPFVPITTLKFYAGAPPEVEPITLPKLYSANIPALPIVLGRKTP